MGVHMDGEDGEIELAWMERSQVDRVGEIDRSEHVTGSWVVEGGALRAVAVDWRIPRWPDEGTGEHSVAGQAAFCREHLEHGAAMLGAFSEETLVGVGVLQPELAPGVAQLAFLHVSRAWRRRGLASRVLSELCDYARARGAKTLYVSATPSESAVGFYRKHGFELAREVHPELFALEPDDIHMTKSLTSSRGGAR